MFLIAFPPSLRGISVRCVVYRTSFLSAGGWIDSSFPFFYSASNPFCAWCKKAAQEERGSIFKKMVSLFRAKLYGVLKKEEKKRVLLKQSKLTLKKAAFSFLFSLGLISKPRKADWNLFCFVAFVERRVCIPPPLYLSFYLTLLFPLSKPFRGWKLKREKIPHGEKRETINYTHIFGGKKGGRRIVITKRDFSFCVTNREKKMELLIAVVSRTEKEFFVMPAGYFQRLFEGIKIEKEMSSNFSRVSIISKLPMFSTLLGQRRCVFSPSEKYFCSPSSFPLRSKTVWAETASASAAN